MKKTKFNTLYTQISENITTSSAGVGSTNPTPNSGDFYAPGDARLPKVLGASKKKKAIVIKRNLPTAL